jgi:hypothetical protein
MFMSVIQVLSLIIVIACFYAIVQATVGNLDTHHMMTSNILEILGTQHAMLMARNTASSPNAAADLKEAIELLVDAENVLCECDGDRTTITDTIILIDRFVMRHGQGNSYKGHEGPTMRHDMPRLGDDDRA